MSSLQSPQQSVSTVACVQMNSGADVPHNLNAAEHWIATAVEQGAQCVFLPENFAFMGDTIHQQRDHAELFGASHKNSIQSRLSAWAEHWQIWIVAGSVPVLDAHQQCRSASLVFNAQGQCVAHYFKIHLFDVNLPNGEHYRESSVFTAGGTVKVLDTPFGRLGLSICYDVRFPELYRVMTEQGVQIISVPAAFTRSTGQAHWHTLLKARAVENLCYVVAAGQAGTHPSGRQTYGHSLIVNPWGECLAEITSDTEEGIVIAPIDLQALEKQREQFPALTHRRV